MTTNVTLPKRSYIIDTTAIISYFDHVFNRGSQISNSAIKLINNAFTSEYETILIIPGVVFVEIFEKWFRKSINEEFQAKFKVEVLERVLQAPNIEIRETDQETLQAFLKLHDPDINLENRDRLILASAVVLNFPLITSDDKLIRYVRKHSIIPTVIF